MGLTNFPNGMTSFGIPVIGSGLDIPVTTGKYFFVSSVIGSDGNKGSSPSKALATLTKAISLCTDAKGDVIVVMIGHVENVATAAAININKTGVTIIGLGNGLSRPTFTLTAAAATIVVTAANVKIKNIIFTANFADIATCFTVTAKDCTIESCLFNEYGADLNWFSCILTGTTNNGADGLTIVGNTRASIDAEALAFVSILANTDRLTITDNIDNQASAADVGHFIIMSSKVCLFANISRNMLNLTGDNNAQTVGVFMTGSSTTSTGMVAYNLVSQLDATTELFDTAALDFGHFQNFMTGVIAKSGYVLPAIDA